MPPRRESTTSTSPAYGVAPNARRVNAPSLASPATMPAAPAALRKDRRESSGVAGHPQGCGRGLTSIGVVRSVGHVVT